MRGGVLARGEGGAGVLPLRREVLLDRPASEPWSELADCGRPHASRGAALLEQGGPFRGRGGGWGDRDCRYDLRVSRGTVWGGATRWGWLRVVWGCAVRLRVG